MLILTTNTREWGYDYCFRTENICWQEPPIAVTRRSSGPMRGSTQIGWCATSASTSSTGTEMQNLFRVHVRKGGISFVNISNEIPKYSVKINYQIKLVKICWMDFNFDPGGNDWEVYSQLPHNSNQPLFQLWVILPRTSEPILITCAILKSSESFWNY